MSDCPAIEARQLCRSYNGKGVLDVVDLSLAVGETMVVMGSNGAGKTTLLQLPGRDNSSHVWASALVWARARSRS